MDFTKDIDKKLNSCLNNEQELNSLIKWTAKHVVEFKAQGLEDLYQALTQGNATIPTPHIFFLRKVLELILEQPDRLTLIQEFIELYYSKNSNHKAFTDLMTICAGSANLHIGLCYSCAMSARNEILSKGIEGLRLISAKLTETEADRLTSTSLKCLARFIVQEYKGSNTMPKEVSKNINYILTSTKLPTAVRDDFANDIRPIIDHVKSWRNESTVLLENFEEHLCKTLKESNAVSEFDFETYKTEVVKKIINYVDFPRGNAPTVEIKNIDDMYTLSRAFVSAMKLKKFEYSAGLPAAIIAGVCRWSNNVVQLHFIELLIKCPSTIVDWSYTRIASTPHLRTPSSVSKDSASKVWCVIPLVEAILSIYATSLHWQAIINNQIDSAKAKKAEVSPNLQANLETYRAIVKSCTSLLTEAYETCPETLFASLCSVENTFKRQTGNFSTSFTAWSIAFRDNLTKIINNNPNATILIKWCLKLNDNAVNQQLISTISTYYYHSGCNITKIYDLAQSLGLLSVILDPSSNSQDIFFVYELAAYASTKGIINYQQWLGDYILSQDASHCNPQDILIQPSVYLNYKLLPENQRILQFAHKGTPAICHQFSVSDEVVAIIFSTSFHLNYFLDSNITSAITDLYKKVQAIRPNTKVITDRLIVPPSEDGLVDKINNIISCIYSQDYNSFITHMAKLTAQKDAESQRLLSLVSYRLISILDQKINTLTPHTKLTFSFCVGACLKDNFFSGNILCLMLGTVYHLLTENSSERDSTIQLIQRSYPTIGRFKVFSAFILSVRNIPPRLKEHVESTYRIEIPAPTEIVTVYEDNPLDLSSLHIVPLPENVTPEINTIMNNLTPENVDSAAKTLVKLLNTEEFMTSWCVSFVKSRVSNASTSLNNYVELINRLAAQKPYFRDCIINLTILQIRTLITISPASYKNPPYSTLQSLISIGKRYGRFLGMLTIANDIPILKTQIDFKALLEVGDVDRLQILIPMVCSILESCKKSILIPITSGWSMSLLSLSKSWCINYSDRLTSASMTLSLILKSYDTKASKNEGGLIARVPTVDTSVLPSLNSPSPIPITVAHTPAASVSHTPAPPTAPSSVQPPKSTKIHIVLPESVIKQRSTEPIPLNCSTTLRDFMNVNTNLRVFVGEVASKLQTSAAALELIKSAGITALQATLQVITHDFSTDSDIHKITTYATNFFNSVSFSLFHSSVFEYFFAKIQDAVMAEVLIHGEADRGFIDQILSLYCQILARDTITNTYHQNHVSLRESLSQNESFKRILAERRYAAAKQLTYVDKEYLLYKSKDPAYNELPDYLVLHKTGKPDITIQNSRGYIGFDTNYLTKENEIIQASYRLKKSLPTVNYPIVIPDYEPSSLATQEELREALDKLITKVEECIKVNIDPDFQDPVSVANLERIEPELSKDLFDLIGQTNTIFKKASSLPTDQCMMSLLKLVNERVKEVCAQKVSYFNNWASKPLTISALVYIISQAISIADKPIISSTFTQWIKYEASNYDIYVLTEFARFQPISSIALDFILCDLLVNETKIHTVIDTVSAIIVKHDLLKSRDLSNTIKKLNDLFKSSNPPIFKLGALLHQIAHLPSFPVAYDRYVSNLPRGGMAASYNFSGAKNIRQSISKLPIGQFNNMVRLLFKQMVSAYDAGCLDKYVANHYVKTFFSFGLGASPSLTYLIFKNILATVVAMCKDKNYVPCVVVSRLIYWIYSLTPENSDITVRTDIFNVFCHTIIENINAQHTHGPEHFNSKIYFLILNHITNDISTPSPVVLAIREPTLISLAKMYHHINPCNYPGFCFAWLHLTTTTSFMTRLVENERTQHHYVELVYDMLKFIQKDVYSAQMPYPMDTIYRGILRVFFLLHSEHPGFLANYYLPLVSLMPPICNQLRNLVLASKPVSARTEPDPLNVRHDPSVNAPNAVIKNDMIAILIESGVKNRLDNLWALNKNATSNSGIVETANALINLMYANGQHNIPLANAVVYHLSQLCQNAPIDGFDVHWQLIAAIVTLATPEFAYIFFSGFVNNLRYFSRQTLSVYKLIIRIIEFIQTLRTTDKRTQCEYLTEILMRCLVERVFGTRPHPWGVVFTLGQIFTKHNSFIFSFPSIARSVTIQSCYQSIQASMQGSAHQPRK